MIRLKQKYELYRWLHNCYFKLVFREVTNLNILSILVKIISTEIIEKIVLLWTHLAVYERENFVGISTHRFRVLMCHSRWSINK